MDSNRIQKYLNSNCGILDSHQIDYLNKKDSGPVSNVLKGMCPHCLGIWVNETDMPKEFYIFYINNEVSLKGLWCRIDFLNPLRNDITYAFCTIINRDFPQNTRLLRSYNNYQTQIITIAEKFGYLVYNEEVDNPELFVKLNPKLLYVPILDKLRVLKSLLNTATNTTQKGGKVNFIYLMYNCRNELTKIGRSIHPTQRERTLQGEEPEIGVIAIWEKERLHEKIIHDKFLLKRKRGEWFDLDISDFLSIRQYMETNKWRESK